MKIEYNLLIDLVRQVICKKEKSEAGCLTDEQLTALAPMLSLAKQHDVLPIIAEALDGYTIPENYAPLIEKLQRYKYAAVYRTTVILSEQSALCTALTDAEIDFILLKGAVIREYYPEPWMRTSSDIDILIHQADLERAIDALGAALGYSFLCRSAHDVSLNAPSGVHVELHFMLIESLLAKEATAVLGRVWEYSTPVSEGAHQHLLSDEMYYYYHIAHMAKHFINGGCGLRSFIDLFIMNDIIKGDPDKRRTLLREGGLETFAEYALDMTRVWFKGLEYNDVTREIEEYILPAGVYGAVDNMVAARTGQRGNRIKYLMSRLFIPYSELKNRYPKMGKYKILLPLLHLRRWLALLDPARRKRAHDELKTIGAAEDGKMNDTAELIKKLKL